MKCLKEALAISTDGLGDLMILLSHTEQYVTATLPVTATSTVFSNVFVRGKMEAFECPGRLQVLLQTPSAVQEPVLCFSNICVTLSVPNNGDSLNHLVFGAKRQQ